VWTTDHIIKTASLP